MNVTRLREATAQDHSRVEGTVPLMHAGLGMMEYVAVLRRMRGVVAAWESFAEAAASGRVEAALRERCRLSLLDEDLACLGARLGESSGPAMPRLTSDAEILGAMYVMEGSRLGGQMIARKVEAELDLSGGCGTRYFRGFGDRTGAMWKEFLGLLEEHVGDDATEDVIRGAKAMFAVFGEWMGGLDLRAVAQAQGTAGRIV